ncbi:hypothetical protein IE53DRAFT_389939 [Violaceomyces palustris]|uniref:Uncharacterized protein n=1 Tax=Violaceomyces palustris TaxID=1673888 RepID=A0ACD0NQ78_9BASI|nr:hypothetical protein IE53DRAFT_389939 [Violaceomyces palustris]
MKFLVAFTALVGLAAAAPSPSSIKEVPEGDSEIVERGGAAGAVASAAIGSAVGAIVTQAINGAVKVVGQALEWNAARETFTKETTRRMWASRPPRAAAAVCYNMGYDVSRRGQMSDLTSVKFSKGPFHTDYDCFYMWGPDNHFLSRGDGGYVNLSIDYDRNRCNFDSRTSDLYCK